jgi:MFS transporter, FHS family, L-fucose permease
MGKKYTLLLFLISLIYVAFGLVTSVIGVIIDKFQTQYHVSLQVAAFLPFAFYLAYGLFSIPFGLLMDKISARLVLFIGMILLTLGCFLLYLCNNYIVVILMIFFIGIGVTAIQTAGNPFIRELDAPKRYTANLTIIIGIGALGYAFSPILVPIFQDHGFSWRIVYLLFGIINLVLLGALTFVKFPAVKILDEEKIELHTITFLLKNPIIITYALGILLYVAAEVGTSSYIIIFLSKVHHVEANCSFWQTNSFWRTAFPSIGALIVALFWLFQALGRLVMGFLMKFYRPRTIFIVHSAGTCIAVLIAIFAPKIISLAMFALVGYFTSVLFTSIFSGAIQSFDKYHGTISGILCTAVVGGGLGGLLVGFIGDISDLRTAMIFNVLAFLYVFGLSVFGKGNVNGLNEYESSH